MVIYIQPHLNISNHERENTQASFEVYLHFSFGILKLDVCVIVVKLSPVYPSISFSLSCSLYCLLLWFCACHMRMSCGRLHVAEFLSRISSLLLYILNWCKMSTGFRFCSRQG